MPEGLPEPSSDLDIDGFCIGHASDLEGKTGITVILCPEGVVAAAEVRGTATGTRQFDSLIAHHHLVSRAHAVVLAGGSAYGLSAADAVIDHLAAEGVGFPTGVGVVPLVPTAILFDLAFDDAGARPSRSLAQAAIEDAGRGAIPTGSVGAGTGATVGKVLGPEQGMKGGFGFASLRVEDGPSVAAAVAVNAYGDVRHEATGELLAGCRTTPDSLELADARSVLARLPPDSEHPWETDRRRLREGRPTETASPAENTTLAVVMTDAALSKSSLTKICQMAFGGFYRTLSPALSLYDGDLLVALASGKLPAHPHQVGVLAETAIAKAVTRAVADADGFGILPAVRDLERGR